MIICVKRRSITLCLFYFTLTATIVSLQVLHRREIGSTGDHKFDLITKSLPYKYFSTSPLLTLTLILLKHNLLVGPIIAGIMTLGYYLNATQFVWSLTEKRAHSSESMLKNTNRGTVLV